MESPGAGTKEVQSSPLCLAESRTAALLAPVVIPLRAVSYGQFSCSGRVGGLLNALELRRIDFFIATTPSEHSTQDDLADRLLDRHRPNR